MSNCEKCKNFVPTQHPLDEMIGELDGEICYADVLKKLRYESIKWAWDYFCENQEPEIPISKESFWEYLRNRGHEDWIVEE